MKCAELSGFFAWLEVVCSFARSAILLIVCIPYMAHHSAQNCLMLFILTSINKFDLTNCHCELSITLWWLLRVLRYVCSVLFYQMLRLAWLVIYLPLIFLGSNPFASLNPQAFSATTPRCIIHLPVLMLTWFSRSTRICMRVGSWCFICQWMKQTVLPQCKWLMVKFTCGIALNV